MLLFWLGGPTETSTAQPAAEPSWVLGSDAPDAGEISDAWLIFPAALGSSAGSTRAEIFAPAGLEAWIRREDETCQAARSRKVRVWEGRIASDAMVPICLLASRAQKLRLLARVRLPASAPPPTVRVAASTALEVQPRFAYAQALLAVLSALLGFLAGVVTHFIEKRGDVKAAKRKAEAAIEELLTRGLAAEVLRCYLQLRAFAANPKSEPPVLQTPGGALLFDESKGALAYLSDPRHSAFLRKFRTLYDLFNAYNFAVDAHQAAEARTAARAALDLLDRSLYEFTSGSPSQGGSL